MDVGTEPYDTGLITFMEALEADETIGGVSGFMTLDIDVKSSESQMKNIKKKNEETKKSQYALEDLCSPVPIVSTIFFLLFMAVKKIVFGGARMIVKLFSCIHECFSAQRAQLF